MRGGASSDSFQRVSFKKSSSEGSEKSQLPLTRVIAAKSQSLDDLNTQASTPSDDHPPTVIRRRSSSWTKVATRATRAVRRMSLNEARKTKDALSAQDKSDEDINVLVLTWNLGNKCPDPRCSLVEVLVIAAIRRPPTAQRPTRMLRATPRAREQSPCRSGAEEKAAAHSACLKLPISPPSTLQAGAPRVAAARGRYVRPSRRGHAGERLQGQGLSDQI